MSVIALPPRTHPQGTPPRPARHRRSTAPTTTVRLTVDIGLTNEPPDPQALRLLELIRELAERTDGAVSVTTTGGADIDVAPDPAGRAEFSSPAVAEASRDALRIRVASRTVLRNGLVIPLTRLEFDLLLFLSRNPRRVFTRMQLLHNVWGYDHTVVRTVDVHVRRLRVKVGEDLPVVTTVYGVGYRLADEVRIDLDQRT